MIFTERTITVVNDSATINKPLILYRGDKNIELKITIAESQFKFRNTDASNVIETTDASYAQLVINTPYGLPIFSDVAVTKNGAVIFVITGAMIDEIREVGAYEIQIRLLDDNKQSRASIPPVSNAIEIREPIAIEDGSAVDSNAVNVAKVNRALTTTSAPLEAFDSQGNYIKKTWGDGDPITDAALNKMEAGIDGVNKKVANNSSQIKEKVNQNQGSEYAGNYLGIAEDGSVVPMPVIGGGSSETTYELIGTLPQTTTFKPVQLLANKDTSITIGDNISAPISEKVVTGENFSNPVYYNNIESYEFNSTNGITMKRVDGAIANNAYFTIAVPVSIGVQYTISAINANGAYWRVGEGDRNVKETNGASTSFVDVSNLSSYVTTQDTRQSLTYTPTKAYLMIEVRPWTNQTGTVDQIMVTTDGTTEYKESTVINLTAGEYYEYVNTIGETIPAPADGTTVELYKKIGGGSSDLSSLYIYIDNKVGTKLNASGYTESGNLIVDEDGNVAIEQESVNENVYVFLGDSIPTVDRNTGGIGAIPDYMQNMIGGTWYNFGIGGTTMSSYRLSNSTYDMFTLGEWADSIATGNFTNQETGVTNGVGAGNTSYSASNKVADAKALDWSTVDTICIHFGTNDLAYKVSELGTSDDISSKNGTMCSSLKYAIERIHSAFPKVKIVVCGIIYRYADGIPISSIITANEQLKKTCYKEGIRFVDLFGEMEVNTTNRTTFLYDGTHPNADGKQRYAECLARYIY